VRYLEAQSSSAERSNEEDSVEDDRLRLIFTCCHPSLPPEAHVALTLREVCGLTTEEIAKAFLIKGQVAGFGKAPADRVRRLFQPQSRHTG
jgi:RNA polymerase sigma-70 factor, ECF subfamily